MDKKLIISLICILSFSNAQSQYYEGGYSSGSTCRYLPKYLIKDLSKTDYYKGHTILSDKEYFEMLPNESQDFIKKAVLPIEIKFNNRIDLNSQSFSENYDCYDRIDSAKYSELISYGYSELSAMVGATGTYCSTRTINGFKFNSSQFISHINFQKTLNTSWDEYLKYHGNGTIDYMVIAEKNLQKSDLEYYNLTAKLSNLVKVIGSNRYQISYHWEDSNGNKPPKAVLEYYGLNSSRVYINGTIEVDKIDFSDIYNYIRKDKSYNGLFDYYETIDQIVIPGPTLYHSYSSKKIDATSWEFSTYRALTATIKQNLYCDDDNEDLEVFINNDSSAIMNDNPKFTFISDDESFNVSASLWEIEGLDMLNLDGYLTALRMIVADSKFQAKVIALSAYESLPTLNSGWGVARRLEPGEINFVGKKNKTIKKGMHWSDFVDVMKRWLKWDTAYCIDRSRERVPCYTNRESRDVNPKAVAEIWVYSNRYDFKKFIVCFEILNIPNESRSIFNSKVADFYVIE